MTKVIRIWVNTSRQGDQTVRQQTAECQLFSNAASEVEAGDFSTPLRCGRNDVGARRSDIRLSEVRLELCLEAYFPLAASHIERGNFGAVRKMTWQRQGV
jgi:hypothetical protein